MKIITQKPTLALSLEEKEALIKAKKILDELTDYDGEVVDELFEDCGRGYDEAHTAYDILTELIEIAVTPNSIEAKSLILSITTEIMC